MVHDAGGNDAAYSHRVEQMTTANANHAHFAIQYEGDDIWMNAEGNLQSQIMALFFDTAEAAQRFLDTRRLRRGFRSALAVKPVSADTIRALAATARHYSTLPPLPARDDRQEWADRAARVHHPPVHHHPGRIRVMGRLLRRLFCRHRWTYTSKHAGRLYCPACRSTRKVP